MKEALLSLEVFTKLFNHEWTRIHTNKKKVDMDEFEIELNLKGLK